MEVHIYVQKFKLLMKNVLEGKIVLNECHAENLLNFLDDRAENSPGKQILDTPSFSDLIFHTLESTNTACTSFKVFLIEVVTILFKNELQFSKMQMQGFQKFATEFCVLGNLNNVPPSDLHLACIKLATVQITHCSGLTIIIENKVWQNVLYPTIHYRPKQVSDAAYKFIAKLVWKLNEYDNEQVLMEVLDHFLDPIVSSGYVNVELLGIENDTELCDKVFTPLSALLAVLTEAEHHAPENKVMQILKQQYVIDHRLYKIYKSTKILRLLKLLNSCTNQFTLIMLRYQLYNKMIDEFCSKMTIFHRNNLVQGTKKRDPLAVIDFVIQANLIWSHFEKAHSTEFDFPLTFERNGQKLDFSMQIIINILVPIKKHVSKLRRCNHIERTDVIEQFGAKMGRTITDYIYSSCYLFGDVIEECNVTLRKQITTHTLKEMLRLKGHLNKAQTGILFQALYYMFEVYSLYDKADETNDNDHALDQEDIRLMSPLLSVMQMLLEEHNISWYDSLEIINIQAVLLNLVKQYFLTSKHVVQVLDLINICVKQFLSPNMSLLVESQKESEVNTLDEIGKVIHVYSQHEEWEVRDSALNLLHSCTEISFIKYVPLQKMITENNLIILATKVGLTDPEFYSQCTALKCLTAATKIDNIWQQVTGNNQHIYIQLINIVKNHGEGMVRKEAVNVLTGVYTNQKIAPFFQNTLYEVMLAAAIDDLHWEVQLAALIFWKGAINNHLTYRGMLDGKFPSVTFSKEKRKIVVLNDIEIQRQLTAIMNYLSSIGCLTVLIECMNEIHNIEVMDQAYGIAKELVEMLNKYKFQKPTNGMITKAVEEAPRYMEQHNVMPMDLSRGSEEERNKVIDSILSVDQSELIMNLHDYYCRTESEDMDIDSPRRELVTPNEFLEMFSSNDYSLILEDKKNCYGKFVSTLDGLLDELLDV